MIREILPLLVAPAILATIMVTLLVLLIVLD